MIKKVLKGLDFKTGKPKLSPEAYQRELVDRILEAANHIHQSSRRGDASWVVYTGMDGLQQMNNLLDEHYLSTTTTVDGVEGQMRLLGVDMVGDDPTLLSARYLFQPRRTLEYVNLDFTITPNGENISFSG